ncbi:MAG: sigma-70 factor domain-containing protein, partial [Thermomicrobiales bacterium]
MMTDLLAKGRDQGFVLADEIIALFPNIEEHVENLDDFYTSLVSEGIEVLEQAPSSLASRNQLAAEERQAAADQQSGVGDSVRLYLQQIGETDLLTMQGEVDLARRMEAAKCAEDELKCGSLVPLKRRRELSAIVADGERARA